MRVNFTSGRNADPFAICFRFQSLLSFIYDCSKQDLGGYGLYHAIHEISFRENEFMVIREIYGPRKLPAIYGINNLVLGQEKLQTHACTRISTAAICITGFLSGRYTNTHWIPDRGMANQDLPQVLVGTEKVMYK